ncbi:MAG: carboxymuconolactone decarboxylase family protein [Leptospirales bacterium]
MIFALQRKKYGRELESALLWGRLPRSFLFLTLFYRTLDRSATPIDPGLRSLITVYISQINGCRFCVDLNSATALERHVTGEKLSDLPRFGESPHYTEQERAALSFADAVTRNGELGIDALRTQVRKHFGETGLLELTALIAFQNLSSKFNNALGVLPQGFCVPEKQSSP